MKKILAAIVAVLSSLILFSGCTRDDGTEFSSRDKYFFSMNTTATLVISDKFTAEKQNAFEELCTAIGQTLTEINSSLSLNADGSAINKFNAAEAGETVEIDATSYKVLSLAKSVYTLTGGYYNPAVYYSVQAYGFNSSTPSPNFEERIPSAEVVAKYTDLASHFGEVELSEEGGAYSVTKPDYTVEVDGETLSMKLDLGGIGKGYAVDEVNKLIEDYGFKYGFFNFGTSSILVKEHYKNGDYKLAFTNPRADMESGTYLSTSVKNVGLSTSGDYEQFFLYDSDGDGDKERYCHVFDPMTGKPVQTGIMSATVIGGSAAEADALTTAIMAMGKEGSVEFINENLSDRKVVFTCDNGDSYEIITNIPESELEVHHSKFTVVSTVSDGKIVLG